VFTSINLPLHKIEQGVLQNGLEISLFVLGDMHRPTFKMEEYMKFQIGLSVKQILKILITFS
jgi:hypothetical protein